ncbi:MAG: glucosamine-6-phosphate deaminase [Flavobacteriales bacterium]|nr:glucosamine-6-phosphate deaminase [Flavobacteriales bacterium]
MNKTVDISYQPVGRYEDKRNEKMHTDIFPNSSIASIAVAEEIAELIRAKALGGDMAILGLATGSSPIKVYSELIRMHEEEGLSFRNVVTFNLDEYYGLDPMHRQSYWYFMHEHLFDHVDILPENINVPSGKVAPEQLNQFCIDYELKIKSYGGLDFQLLGIGRTGHIGFNEPGSHRKSATRLITLDHLTRSDAASDFAGIDNVPRKAITMGVGTIMTAKRIIMLAWGEKKAEVVKEMIEGEVTGEVPATFLQDHFNTTVLIDEPASSELVRIKTPWLVGPVNWTESLIIKAVVWLAEKEDKPILKLTDRDYNDNGMSSLVALEGSAYDLNIRMFNYLSDTITGWPGGKPNADDSRRPERAEPAHKKIVIFSPHPDDDVISMGGTLQRLAKQGHEVHVVYQTSGNIAVADHDALRFAEFALQFKNIEVEGESSEKYENVIDLIKNKSDNEIDPKEVRVIKTLIRRGEAIAATRYCGIKDENVHYLDMPFYDTGKAKKNPLGDADIKLIVDILEDIQPNQIFAAGDLADPHGTHKVCLDGIFAAIAKLKKKTFMKECYVWLYRGAWHEWDVNDIEMAVPISPEELARKRKAIFFHQSQKDGVMFLGNDHREFWQRSEDRNRGTADLYDKLGLPEYEAIEAFKRYRF